MVSADKTADSTVPDVLPVDNFLSGCKGGGGSPHSSSRKDEYMMVVNTREQPGLNIEGMSARVTCGSR